jgi:hypothetical protein
MSAVARREDARPGGVLGVVPRLLSRNIAGRNVAGRRVVEFAHGQRLGGFRLRVPRRGVVGGDQRAAVPPVVVVVVHPVIEVKIPESSALGHTSMLTPRP